MNGNRPFPPEGFRMTATTVPTVPTVRAERYGEYGLRVRCPHCRRVHGHGTAGDPGPEYGHRASDCDGPGYFIVER